MTTTADPIHPAKPEIMSPAGYWPQLEAAVEAGADAVYFGLKHFTARAKVGFALGELPEVMRTLHQRGVKGYVTFNTLIFDHELTEAAKCIAEIAASGADSIIVQDVGIAQLARQIAPQLDLHGSTQMSITSAEGIELARRFGVNRVVLARELSLENIRQIRRQSDCELEIFVHGALCVSYSGQCFSSEAWGGRSANRGQCAQACRLPYQLIVDDQLRPLGDARYLLSPGDLYTLRQIPEIVQVGISALKIEGRYKDAGYVALTTSAYRQAVDDAYAALPQIEDQQKKIARTETQLEQIYSRGLGPHFISGTDHQAVVRGRSPRHRGIFMGKVVRIGRERVIIRPTPMDDNAALKAGDGIVFDAADWRSPQEKEEGGRLYHVNPIADDLLELRFKNGVITYERIRVGDWVWRSHDPAVEKAARPFIEPAIPQHKQALSIHATAHEGTPLRLEWRIEKQSQITVTVESKEPLGVAQTHAISTDYLHEKLGRLGNTAYRLESVTLDARGKPFAPSSLLNRLRRVAVEQLVEMQRQPTTRTINEPLPTLIDMLENSRPTTTPSDAKSQDVSGPQLHLLVRTAAQLQAAIDCRPASITLDYLDLYGLRPAVEQIKRSGLVARVASPRVLKPKEERIVNFLLKLECELLIRSTGLLQTLTATAGEGNLPPLIGDFSLNAANALSAETFLQMGLVRITPTHDLNATQVAELAQNVGAEKVEVIAYQHLPVFHTEHCLFCRFLSDGSSKEDCGHPCEKHSVGLRDEKGRTHPVMADVGCRNTIFGAEAQEASRHLEEWQEVEIQHYRLEFVHESASDVAQIGRAFGQTLAGKRSTDVLKATLQTVAPQGSTEGSLFVPDDYLSIPLMG